MYKRSAFLFALLTFTTFLFAQQPTSPEEFLGYELGTQFSRHHQVVAYFKKVASEMPDQVKLEPYGETNERRPLYLAYVSSEDNLRNLETIRENNLKNAGVLEGNPTASDIAIVWLSYNVHGTEASSTEASMKTLYKLLTEHQAWLKNTVVIIDPCLNPDGRDRYVNWYNETASTPYDVDQQASENNQPWPGGRANHYLFDLNRDWAWASQVESTARLKVYNKWLPHIHVDFHEQGMNEPYYFAPAAEPFHEIITDWQRDFQTQIGKNNATYFDAKGWLYFTRERFDLLYPSYGDTYPTYLGAIGMTYEQAGQSGLGVLNDEGVVLTLVDRVAHHTISGLSTVEMASKNAEKLTSEFKKFFDNTNLKAKSYVMQGHPDNIQSLKDLLQKHHIQYGNATKGKVSGHRYATGKAGSMTTTTNDLVVSTDQPKGKMVSVLFEPQTTLVDSLTYDITAWSLPYAYGLDAIASTKLVPTTVTGAMPTRNAKNTNAVAYIAKWNHLKDAEFLAALLQQNIKVRFTEKPFTISQPEQHFERGSLIITRSDNPAIANFDDLLIETANKLNRTLVPALSGFSKNGPDFGSPDVKLVGRPKIAMLSGAPVSTLNYGEIWHFFEQQLHYPITTIHTKDFKNARLDKYHVLILPNGYYSSYFDAEMMDHLKQWIRKGGKLIAIDGALNVFSDADGFGLKRNKPQDSTKTKNNLIPYADRERESAKEFIIGAIFKSHVDNTHPMAFGYEPNYFTLKLGNASYRLLEDGYNIAWLGDHPTPVSGFAGSDAVQTLGNTLVFGEERIGNGSIVYMVDNTLFRSFWEHGKLFLANAVFFVNNNSFEL